MIKFDEFSISCPFKKGRDDWCWHYDMDCKTGKCLAFHTCVKTLKNVRFYIIVAAITIIVFCG